MKVLIVNKFLHLNGGSETYVLKIGRWLEQNGHEVQYFGMEHPKRCMGNHIDVYTTNMDFHKGNKLTQITYAIKTIYSREARIKIRKVLEDFRPDVCHINNFNYQLTPSIILEIRKWSKDCKIVYTAHDYQLVCPNHMCNNPSTHENCEKCLKGKFWNCTKNRCIHGSTAKSFVGTMEAYYWNFRKTYELFDKIVCCSWFLKEKMDKNPVFAKRTIVMHNFVDRPDWIDGTKEDYVLYFGRYSTEKGIKTLIDVAKEMQDVQFVFAGIGPLEEEINAVGNIKNVGFQEGSALENLIRRAKFSIYPSEWYENCPFSVMESQMYGTPVLGADIGGIPELIHIGKTGELFESGNREDLKLKIRELFDKCEDYAKECRNVKFYSCEDYCEKLLEIYKGD